MTFPEVLMWQAIRGEKLGVRFRRQHPIGPYILDFYCDEARLAVEIDGASHEDPDRMRHDCRRTEWLLSQEIAVLPLSARSVLHNLEGVVASLQERVCVRPPPPLRGPPPPAGEE